MKKFSCLFALSGLISLPVLAAEPPASPHTLTGNIGLTTDYLFRGVSQTQNGPAIQGGFDYSHASGLYLGTFASNVDWVSQGYKDNNSMEIDLYGGYKGTVGDFGYDVGLITYYYPGDKIAGIKSPDTTEAYLAGTWKFLTLKYSHVVSSNFIGWYDYANGRNSRGSNYLELNGSHDLGNGWGLVGHIGHQKVKNVSGADYTDWKLGVTKDIGYGVVTLAYSDTDADVPNFYTLGGEEIADGRVVLSFAKTF